MFQWWKTKIKTHSKTIASQDILFINVIVIQVPLFCFEKPAHKSVSSVIFNIQIELKNLQIIKGKACYYSVDQ